MSAKLLASYDIGAWHLAPGVKFIGGLAEGLGILVILGGLLGISLYFIKHFERRNLSTKSFLKNKRR